MLGVHNAVGNRERSMPLEMQRELVWWFWSWLFGSVYYLKSKSFAGWYTRRVIEEVFLLDRDLLHSFRRWNVKVKIQTIQHTLLYDVMDFVFAKRILSWVFVQETELALTFYVKVILCVYKYPSQQIAWVCKSVVFD